LLRLQRAEATPDGLTATKLADLVKLAFV
jgi:hypothetical protein